jgi:hypothetical protein
LIFVEALIGIIYDYLTVLTELSAVVIAIDLSEITRIV